MAVTPILAQDEVYHPSYTFQSLMKPNFQPLVGGLAWMPDGKLLVVTIKNSAGHDPKNGPSDAFLLDQVMGSNPSNVTVTKFASGFRVPLGALVVDDEVYVWDNAAGLVKLPDANGDGTAEAQQVVRAQGINGNDRHWIGGIRYKDGYFYAAIGVVIETGASAPNQPANRGVVVKISKDGSSMETVAGGLRNPNGMGLGPNGEILVTDNQGDWLPSSKVLEIRQGEFYGHKNTAFDDKPMTNPVAWLPHGELANSPGTPLFLKTGPYAGQWLIAEVTQQRILRMFTEKVAGRLQGAVFFHSWNMPAGVNRLLDAPDGTIILGGVGGDGGWTFRTPWYDIQKMTPTDKVPFEMKAVRSLGSGSMEVEFTKPISAAMAAPSRFGVRQWHYTPTASYGGPKMEDVPLNVTAANLSADGLKVKLDISGLKTGKVVRIRLSGVTSTTGEAAWHNDAYYTLNAFGPGEDLVVALGDRASARNASSRKAGIQAGRLSSPLLPGQIFSADGRLMRDFSAKVRP